MNHRYEEHLTKLGMTLPAPAKPVASYLSAVTCGNMVVVSGQLPISDGELIATGPTPSQASESTAKRAAAQCAVNALAALKAQLDGDWSRFVRIVRLGVFVLSDNGFVGQPAIANGASDLLAQVFGEAGLHARVAVGVNALPLDATVEVELTAEIRPL